MARPWYNILLGEILFTKRDQWPHESLDSDRFFGRNFAEDEPGNYVITSMSRSMEFKILSEVHRGEYGIIKNGGISDVPSGEEKCI